MQDAIPTGSQPERPSRRQVTPPKQVASLPSWIDGMILIIVVFVAGVSLYLTVTSGAFSQSLLNDTNWSWHIVRSAGMMAYSLLAASTIWGLFLSSHIIKDWSPGPLSLLLHSATSWLALVLALAHAGLLVFDKFYTYTLPDLLIPFIGPYRPFAVGLGVIALWLTLAITISFGLRKLLGHRNWLWLHYTSYIAFVLVTFHAVLAGTDATRPGMLIIFGIFGAIVILLLLWRVIQGRATRVAHG